MRGQMAATLRRWRARRHSSRGGAAYALYAAVLVSVIAVLPVVRALWIAASAPAGLALLTSPEARLGVAVGVVCLWLIALLVGAKRGPAVLAPFLMHVLAASNMDRSVTLGPTLLRAGAILTALCAAGAAFVGAVLVANGEWQVSSAVAFAAAGAAVGVVAAMLWLLGQVCARFVGAVALVISVVAVVSVVFPALLVFTPWGWVGQAYAFSAASAAQFGGVVLLAVSLAFAAPALLNRLTATQLGEQGAQWERATAFSFSLDLGAVSEVYVNPPRRGRSIRAIVPAARQWRTFFVRDVVGQCRAPLRCTGAVAATVSAGVILALASLPGVPSALLAVIAGLMIYVAAGVFASGLRYAARVSGDYPLFGMSDRRLILLHLLFPFVMVVGLGAIAASVCALVVGIPCPNAAAAAGAAGVLAIGLRLSGALKGPLPLSLLMPMDTPVGDLSSIVRIAWALSDPLLMCLGALAIAASIATPVPFIAVLVGVTALVGMRWRRRR